MESVPTAAYVAHGTHVEVVANFGILAARDATRNEIDTLADALFPIVSSFTVVNGHRYEFATGAAEVAGSEVRISFPPHALPDDPSERDALIARVMQEVDAWVRAAAARPPSEGDDLASRIIRGPPIL